MVATASTEHSHWLALAFLAVFVYATQAIAFEWKPGLTRTIEGTHRVRIHAVLLLTLTLILTFDLGAIWRTFAK